MPGYPRQNIAGYSEVTVDNTRNDADVFVKLVSTSGEKAFPVRHFFIPAGSTFTVKTVRPGDYDVRYKDLKTGALFKTQPFTLSEARTEEGVRFKSMTMTLYKVRDGNMQTFPIDESAFN